MKPRLAPLVLTTCLLVPGSVLASWTCTASTVPVSFGTYNPASTSDNIAGAGSITVSCWLPDDDDHNIYVHARIDAGAHPNGTQRRMANGTSYMNYGLYTNSGRTTVWDTTSYYSRDSIAHYSNSQPLQLQTKNVTVSHTWNVYGKIPKLQSVAGGTYTDTPVVTIWHDISNVAP